MKTIITTVGTSIFTNLIKKSNKSKAIDDSCKELENIRFSKWDDKNIAETKKELQSLVKSEIVKQGDKASAEIDSILQIAKDEKVIIHLLATDSILSVLAAEIIKDWFKDKQTVYFNAQYSHDVIEDLQVESLIDFKLGLTNLVKKFYSIVGPYFNPNDYILNITGGYKGLIPFVTILGQITKISIQYKFEDTDKNLEIPKLPIKRDDDLFNTYLAVFEKIEQDVKLNVSEYYQFTQDAESCLEYTHNGKMFTLNSLGLVFWEDYKKDFFSFYAPDEIYESFMKQNNIQHFLKQTFIHKEQRDKYNVCEDTHKTVCKKFHDTPRIYWFLNDAQIFIYKTFENHDDHERYIKSVKFSESFKNEIIKNSKLRKIKIENV